MATSRATALLLRQQRQFFVQNAPICGKFSTCSRILYQTSTYPLGYTQDPGEIFFRDDVQLLLEKLTGCNYEKLFKPRKLGNKLSPPKYELLTQEELDKLMAEANQKAKLKLKMPPLLKERKPIEEVVARNPELQGYDTAKYVFTDISYGLSEKKRKIVVRDPDGVLRKATWEEWAKMCQIYFPRPGKQLTMPQMFQDQHLQSCLERGEYEFILNRACVQFEPDEPDYIRVTRKTYDVIDDKRHYTSLRSTRHFGPMTLHLVLSKRLDDLLCHFVETEDLDAATNLVRLFHIANPGVVPSVEAASNDFKLIQEYILNHALKKSALELSWATFLEIVKQRSEMAVGNREPMSN